MGNSISGLSLESLSGAYSKYSNTVTDTTTEGDSGYLDFDSYLELLVAKMQNQDFNDPMSDSEVLQQMAQYSMLEGIKNMTNQSNISYASSLVGKAVTISDGGDYSTGLVDSIVVNNNIPYLVVNGNQYATSAISEIASNDVYTKLTSLKGQTVEAKTVDEEGNTTTVEGKVTDVLLLGGEGFVVLDDATVYSLSDVTLKSGESENEEENSNSSDTVTAYNNVEVTEVSSGYAAQSAALMDDLFSMIDAISNNDDEDLAVQSAQSSIDQAAYETVTVQELDVPDYAAAFYASADDELMTLSSSASTDETLALSAGVYDSVLTTSNFNSVVAADRDGRVSSILTNEESYEVLTNSSYETRYSERYGLEVKSDTKPGISTSDCEPHRLNADKYPEEAALADKLGTRMYDIKYINNTSITSRIDTSKVIGKSISGRAFCEIGYSGVGKLGEVVTFADGTQRVEILLDNGNSCWLNTSGDYTLDEICDPTAAPGSLADMTPYEKAIRNYSKEHSSSEIANMSSFKNTLLKYGINAV
ncbi:MAG: hypothetical protein IJ007_01460 [Oscillospiraceae bacterium]|nr:hypothetical protein [Oscillospiraceae bacterium]